MSETVLIDSLGLGNEISTMTYSPSITDWNVGIFAIIGSAITFIGILLTIRFVYIDKTHEERIKKILDDRERALEDQERLVDDNQFTKDNVRWFAEYISGFNIAIENLTNYKKANSRTGTYIDVICMAVLFGVGAIATTGFFEKEFILLLIITGVVTFCPITHFIIQLRRTRYNFRFNHS